MNIIRWVLVGVLLLMAIPFGIALTMVIDWLFIGVSLGS